MAKDVILISVIPIKAQEAFHHESVYTEPVYTYGIHQPVLIALYASVSDSAGRRTREMGIRVTLGASGAHIVWISVRDSMAVLLCGGTAGIIFAVAAIHPVASLAPDGVDPWSPAMFTAVLLLFLASGATAAYLPARRVAKLDPSFELRDD